MLRRGKGWKAGMEKSLRDDFLQDFGAQGEQGDGPIVFRMFLRTLFEYWDDIGLFPCAGKNSRGYGQVTYDLQGNGQDFSALLQDPRAEAVGAAGLVSIQFRVTTVRCGS